MDEFDRSTDWLPYEEITGFAACARNKAGYEEIHSELTSIE